MTMSNDASDGNVQCSIEAILIGRLSRQNPAWRRLSWIEVATKYRVPEVWHKINPDAVWETEAGDLAVAECYTRTLTPKSGTYGKLAKDCLKLIAIQKTLARKAKVRCLMILPDELVERMQGTGWLVTFIRQSVEVVGMTLLESERKKLNDAVERQADGQSRRRRKSETSE
jgi:hypothetical protein